MYQWFAIYKTELDPYSNQLKISTQLRKSKYQCDI